MTYECNICNDGKIFKDGRAFHMHLIRFHPEEYEKAGRKKEKFNKHDADPRPAAERKTKIQTDRPAGFRILDKTKDEEARAMADGYLFVDDTTELYKIEDARKKGWI